MSRPRGSIIGARPTWTTTATSGIWTLRQAEEMQAAGQWPRGPVAPTSPAGTPGDQQVALTWVAPATTHGTITDYVVEYTPAAGSPTVVATGSTAASYTLTGLTNDTEYTVRVAGVNHTRGDWSDSVAVTPSAAAGGWDISAAVYTQSLAVGSQEPNPRGLFIGSSGSKLYIVGVQDDEVNEYSLSTPYDLSTGSHVRAFSVATQDINPNGVAFSSDGTKMYVVGSSGQDINEYSLSTAWNISTASYSQNFSTASQDSSPLGVAFKSDGTRMYVVGESGLAVYEYALSTSWDISTASYVHSASVSAQESSPRAVTFKTDGTKMYVIGTVSDAVNEYSLSTAWDVSTASYSQNFSVASQDSAPTDVAFADDGSKMFVLGNINDTVYEYSL